MKRLFILIGMLWLCGFIVNAQETVRPRLWLTATSLEQYRQWATDANPLYSESLLPLAEQARADMDANLIIAGDLGGYSYEDYIIENYACLFAFMSLIHPDTAQGEDYAQRARTLLLHVMTIAAQGAAAGEPFRDPSFSLSDRSRWYGVSFPLTVDWIYPSLLAEDKALIRTVFLRWMAELTVAETTTMNHPEPLGVLNDPILVRDVDRVRWAGNNYYTAHMRNMGMMALAFDPADDPDGALAAYRDQAMGSWLYVHDHLTRTEMVGGFGTEGFEYSPQSVGYAAQFLLALHTAGYDDPAQFGIKVTFERNPFWNDVFGAYFHSLSPAPLADVLYGQPGYQPAWYGSGQDYLTPDFIQLFGVLGVYDMLTGNAERLNAARWLQTVTPLGGADALVDRSNDGQEFYKAILYFMLFDPNAPVPDDPRPAYPTTWYAPGMRRLLSRTDWSEDAAWLTYNLTWNRVDHQTGGGNGIEFYRDGEWLTKIHVGYDLDYLSSDHLNTLAVQNDPIDRDDYRLMLWERGSQWLYSANDPQHPQLSARAGYLYVYGDSTPLYNSAYEELDGVQHVSRTLLWLKPDIVIVADRAITRAAGLKRFHLNLPYEGVVSGSTMTMTTPVGQQFVVTALLPAAPALRVEEWVDEASAPPAHGEPMKFHFMADSANSPDERFIHVLQGVDAGSAAQPVALETADEAGVYDGVGAGRTLVLLRRETVLPPVTALAYEADPDYTTHLITGLMPDTGYDVGLARVGERIAVTITQGSAEMTDGAGVLVVDTIP